MDQLPRMSEILTPAIDALLGDLSGDRRAARERYAQSGPTGGRWGDGRGQAEVIRARLTKEVMATRLDRCGGQELKDLAKSEYFAELPPDPQKAVGETLLQRRVVTGSPSQLANFKPGVIPAGAKIKRSSDATSFVIPIRDAEYELLESVVWGPDDNRPPTNNGDGTWTHFQANPVNIQATREGPHANWPIFAYNPDKGPMFSTKLFDATFEILIANAAGGTLGIVDDQIRALARAMSTGSNGPTQQATVAGALTNPGVRRAVYYDDQVKARGMLFVADESWACSLQYRAQVLRALKARPWIGWGCKVAVFSVTNIGTVVLPTILLRGPEFVSQQAEITANVKAALQEYFDERPDWYTWTLNAIGSVVGGADDRILACTAVKVTNEFGQLEAAVDADGVVTGEEPPPSITPAFDQIFHRMVTGIVPMYQVSGFS